MTRLAFRAWIRGHPQRFRQQKGDNSGRGRWRYAPAVLILLLVSCIGTPTYRLEPFEKAEIWIEFHNRSEKHIGLAYVERSELVGFSPIRACRIGVLSREATAPFTVHIAEIANLEQFIPPREEDLAPAFLGSEALPYPGRAGYRVILEGDNELSLEPLEARRGNFPDVSVC